MTTPTQVTPIQSATEAIQEVIGGYDPENLMSAGQVFPDLAEFWQGLATSLQTLAGRLEDESPIDNSLAESLREMAATVGGLSDTAQEAHTDFQRIHEADIERIENPRPAEQKADFQAHQ